METEIKLLITGSHLAKIVTQGIMRELARGEPVEQQLTAHYFDSAGRKLRRKGLTLRVRQEGGQALQTLKHTAPEAAQSGAMARGEWQTEVDKMWPDLRKLANEENLPRKQRKVLLQVRGADNLAEQFQVEVARKTLMLEIDGSSVEMALDDGKVVAAGESSRFCEVELELKAGKKSALYAAARHLAHHVPAQISFVSKADRGFALLGEAAAPVKAAPVAFPRDASVEQGMRRIFAACLVHAQANVAGFLHSDDVEYLHQLRVGMRRFKSALKLFRDLVALPPALREQFDELSSLLGAARDADVLLLSTLADLNGAEKQTQPMHALLEHAARHAAERRTAAREALHSTRHAQLMIALFEWVDCKRWRRDVSKQERQRLRTPLAGYAHHAVIAAHALVARRAGKVRDEQREEKPNDKADDGGAARSLHRLRIAGKQSRYAVDFFTDIERPQRAEKYIRQLTRAQDALGALNDVSVARHTLADFARADAALGEQVDAVVDQLDAIERKAEGASDAPWRKLGKPSTSLLVKRLVRDPG